MYLIRLSPDTETASPFILDSPAPRTGKNRCLLFKPPVHGCFRLAACTDYDTSLLHPAPSSGMLRTTPCFHLASARRRSPWGRGRGQKSRYLFPQVPPCWAAGWQWLCSCLVSLSFNHTSLSLPLSSRTMPRPHPFRCG